MTSALEKFQNCEGEPTQFDDAAKNFAEGRIKFWTELIIQNQYPDFDEKFSGRQIVDENILLMEDNDEED